MKTKIEKLKKSQVKIEVELSCEEFKGFIEKALSQLNEDLELKGFRKGKAPKDVVEKMVGKERVIVEAGDLAVQESYKKAVLENNLEPISSPKVEIKKIGPEDPLIFEAVFPVMPEVKLPDYKKIASKTKKQEVAVEEREIEDSLKWIQKSRAKFTVKLGIAEKGDFVEVNYWPGDIKDAFILGEGHFHTGFEEAIYGMKPGEEKKDIEVKDQKEKFSIKLNSLQKMEYPELNDEFARSLGKIDNLEMLKNNIKEGLMLEKEKNERERARNEITQKIAESANMEIPEILIEREQEHNFEHFKEDVQKRLGISFEDYLKKIGKKEEEIKKMLLPEVEKKIRNFLVLREIGKKENISVTDKEVEEEASKTLKYYPDADKIDLNEMKSYTKEVIITEKIFQLLEDLVK
jgi:trigger factor